MHNFRFIHGKSNDVVFKFKSVIASTFVGIRNNPVDMDLGDKKRGTRKSRIVCISEL